MGKKLFSIMMKNTFYGHFVAGEDQLEIRGNVQKMMKYGVKPILDYSAEEDLESQQNKTAASQLEDSTPLKRPVRYDPSEAQSDKNLKIFMDCIDVVECKRLLQSFFKYTNKQIFNLTDLKSGDWIKGFGGHQNHVFDSTCVAAQVFNFGVGNWQTQSDKSNGSNRLRHFQMVRASQQTGRLICQLPK